MNPAVWRLRGEECLPSSVPTLENIYRVPEAGVSTRQYIGLDRNERVTPFPDWFMDNIREAVNSTLISWYPSQDELHLQLRQQLGLAAEKLILTPSSDAAFKALYEAYIQPGDSVVMLNPSYAMFPVYAEMFGAESVLVPYTQDVELDTTALLDSIVPGVRLLMLANPNQPTGTLLGEKLLRDVIEKAADVKALVAMDEAYYPFSKETALPWLEDYANLLVIRTFSKAAGLAGLRIGFVAGHPDVITNLNKLHTVNDLNSMSVLCLGEILKHPEIIDDYVAQVRDGHRLLSDRLATLELPAYPTVANFVLIQVGDRCQPSDLVEALKRRGYLIKGPLDAVSLAGCVRVTLGPPEVMEGFADALEETLKSDF